MILVTGASGNVGGAVLEAARRAGLPLRAMYRSQADAKKAGAHEDAVIADFADPASLRRGLAGITRFFWCARPFRS